MHITDQQVRQALYTFVSRVISNSFTAVVEDNSKAESEGFVKVAYNDLEYNVKLQALTNATDKGLVQIPKVGSQLFCVNEGNSSNRFVALAYTEIEKVIFKQGDNSITLNEEGIDLLWKDNSITANEQGIMLKRGDNSIELNDKAEDGIIFNGGNLGHTVIIGNLVKRLNEVENSYNSLVSIFNAHSHGGNGASMPATQVSSTSVTEIGQIENTKIKQ